MLPINENGKETTLALGELTFTKGRAKIKGEI